MVLSTGQENRFSLLEEILNFHAAKTSLQRAVVAHLVQNSAHIILYEYSLPSSTTSATGLCSEPNGSPQLVPLKPILIISSHLVIYSPGESVFE